jgi:tetratricopeptide (TPR) repeat protein
MESPERLLPGLLQLARGLMLLGRQDEARVLVAEGMGIAEANPSIAGPLAIVADQATALGVAEEIVEIIELAPDGPWKDAALADARGEHSRAADIYERFGLLAIAAEVRFGAAGALLEEGRTAEGLAELDKALAFFRPVGATFFLERAERLVAEARTA